LLLEDAQVVGGSAEVVLCSSEFSLRLVALPASTAQRPNAAFSLEGFLLRRRSARCDVLGHHRSLRGLRGLRGNPAQFVRPFDFKLFLASGFPRFFVLPFDAVVLPRRFRIVEIRARPGRLLPVSTADGSEAPRGRSSSHSSMSSLI
jgi:hypothetical protein